MTCEDVRQWIEWLREQPLSDEKYPTVDTIEITCVWREQAEDHGFNRDREKVLSCFTEVLSVNPTDFFVRFAAIHYYRTAWESAKAYPGRKLMTPEDIDRATFETLADLKLVVRALPAEQVPADWDYLIWEV